MIMVASFLLLLPSGCMLSLFTLLILLVVSGLLLFLSFIIAICLLLPLLFASGLLVLLVLDILNIYYRVGVYENVVLVRSFTKN